MAIIGMISPAVRRANSSTSRMPMPATTRSVVLGPMKDRISMPSASRM